MPSKLAAATRGIYPPPICKKQMPPPPLTPLPCGAIIATFEGHVTDNVGYHFDINKQVYLYQLDRLHWAGSQRAPTIGIYGADFSVTPNEDAWLFTFTYDTTVGGYGYFETDAIPLGDALPFAAGPIDCLPGGWGGRLTVKFEQYM